MINPQTPIIVGVGQCVDQWDGHDTGSAPSPAILLDRAARAALADARAKLSIDRLIVVRTMLDSVPGALQPFGRCANPPGTLAATLGIHPRELIYSEVGGDQPQTLVNEAAEAIFSGDVGTVMLAGAEATAALKTALKRGVTLDWSQSACGEFTDRGLGPRLLSAYEIRNGLGAPTQTYPAFEHALRARWKHSREQHQLTMAALWTGFSRVAAANPYAQYPVEHSPSFLSTPARENYAIADPYLKWHVAQDAVNQGAALIMTSVDNATKMGIDTAKFIYLHGYAQGKDRVPTERPDLSRSRAMELTLEQALASASKVTADISHFDLYSCFPCAVFLAAEALGLDWRSTVATVTGGLPFFGGAGNNYSMHAIATMVERLRVANDTFGLVLANGGFLSKEAAGVYSACPAKNWQPVSSAAIQAELDAQPQPMLLSETAIGTIATFTVAHSKGEPSRAYVIAQCEQGRSLARVRAGDVATMHALLASDPIGRPVAITHEDGTNYFNLT